MAHDRDGGTEVKVLKVRVPTELHDRLHVARIMQGRPMASIVRDAIEAYLRKQEAPENGAQRAGAQT